MQFPIVWKHIHLLEVEECVLNEFSLKLLSDIVMGTILVPLTITLASVQIDKTTWRTLLMLSEC